VESFGQVRVLGRRLFGSSGEEKAVRNRGTKLSSSPIFCAYKVKKKGYSVIQNGIVLGFFLFSFSF
jgi:hypothetical protein